MTQSKTTREPVLHISTGGMDRSGQPFQVAQGEKGKWWTQFNLRKFQGRLTQVARKKKLTQVEQGHPHQVLALASFPAGTASASNVVALTRKSAYRVKTDSMVRMKKETNDVEFTWDNSYYRWDSVMYNNRLFFVNPVNPVHYTDGTMVDAIGTDVPAGTYVEVWFDRLVVGRPVFHGAEMQDGVRFSSLYQLDEFNPKVQNEADYREFVEYQQTNSPLRGVTGVRKLGERLMVYNSTSIWAASYVGQPWIINTVPISKQIGNTLPYTLVSTGEAHYFLSIPKGSFYKLSDAGLEECGGEVGIFFLDDLHPDPRLRRRTYAYTDDTYSEVGWVYISKNNENETFDRALVYNYETKEWYLRSMEDAQCFCEAEYQAQTVDDISEQVDDLDNITCDELSALSFQSIGRIWGGPNGTVHKETDSADDILDVVTQEVPYLESGDIFFSDTQRVKEEDYLTINATTGTLSEEEPAGIKVYIATRDAFDDDVDYVQVGTWTTAKQDDRINYQGVTPRNGKIWRYKFVWNGLTGISDSFAGSPDKTFTLGSFDGPVYAIVQRADGMYYVSGRFSDYNGDPALGLCRLKTDGTLDTTFVLPGAGFAIDSNHVPPTQLAVTPANGVIAAASFSRYVERNLWGGGDRWLHLDGADVPALLKFLPTGALDPAFLANDETYVLGMCRFSSFGGPYDRLDGFVLTSNYLWMGRTMNALTSGYAEDGCSMTRCHKTTGAGQFLITMTTLQVDQAKKACDICSINGQIVFAYFGYDNSDLSWEYDDINLATSTALSGTPYDAAQGLGIAVFDESFNLDVNWMWGGYRRTGPVYEYPLVTLSVDSLPNGSMHTWSRVVNGTERNTLLASYNTPVTPVTGTWGTSVEGAHRGLFNLRTFGYADNINLYRDAYGTDDPDLYSWEMGLTSGSVYIAWDFFVLKDRLVVKYEGNTIFDTGFTNGHGSVTLPFSGAATTIEFEVNNAGDTVDPGTRWRYAASVTGQPNIGAFSPSVWDNATGNVSAGFTPTTDLDGFYDGVFPILVRDYTNSGESDRGVFVVGSAVKFKDTTLDQGSPMWFVSANGTLNEVFRLTQLENSFESTWDDPKLPRILCAAFVGSANFAFIGGRFTKLAGTSAGHAALIDTRTGNRVSSVVLQEGTVDTEELTGGGCIGVTFTSFEQNVYAFQTER